MGEDGKNKKKNLLQDHLHKIKTDACEAVIHILLECKNRKIYIMIVFCGEGGWTMKIKEMHQKKKK